MTPAQVAQGVLDSIEQQPTAFDMGSWVTGIPLEFAALGLSPEEAPAHCGTTLCIAGWAAHNDGWLIHPGGACTKDGIDSSVRQVATDLMDVDYKTDWIFFTHHSAAVAALKEIAAGRIPDYDWCGA